MDRDKRMILVRPGGMPQRSEAAPVHIPSWLADPNGIGPCPCGQPVSLGQPYTILEGPLFKRYFHIGCAQQMIHLGNGEYKFPDDS